MMLRSIQRELRAKGFDLCHPIHTNWYNRMIKREGLVDSGALDVLPEPSAVNDDGMVYNAVLIGNTKSVWQVFLAWLSEQKQDVMNPLDTFAESRICSAFDACFEIDEVNPKLKSYDVFWSNGKRQTVNQQRNSADASTESFNASTSYHCVDYSSLSFLVSMQRLAQTTGQYWQDDNATKLCVHPEYGTWTAFRAVVVLQRDCQNHTSIPPMPKPCSCPVSDEEIKKAKEIFDLALHLSSSVEHGYGTTLDKSWEELCKYLHNTVCSGSDWEKVPPSMKPWIQLRDAFGVGRETWKYDDAQLLYHYTKDPEILSRELKKIRTQHKNG